MKVRQDKDKYNVGKNIRKYRIQNNLKQEQVVAKMQLLGIKISRSSYGQLEAGLYNIKIVELLALCKIFNISIDQFFEGMKLDIDE